MEEALKLSSDRLLNDDDDDDTKSMKNIISYFERNIPFRSLYNISLRKDSGVGWLSFFSVRLLTEKTDLKSILRGRP